MSLAIKLRNHFHCCWIIYKFCARTPEGEQVILTSCLTRRKRLNTPSQSGVQIKVSRYLAQQLYHMIKFNFKIKSLPNVYVSRVLCLTHLTLDMDTRIRVYEGCFETFPATGGVHYIEVPQKSVHSSRYDNLQNSVVGVKRRHLVILNS